MSESPRAAVRDAWRDPAVETVAPGVHRVPVPLPTSIRAVNVYALESPDGLTLVDGGWAPFPEGEARLAAALASLGAELGDVRRFLVTHAHRDHYSYAVEHRAAFGSRVCLGADEAASLAALRAEPARPHPYQLDRLRRGGAADLVERLTVRPHDPALWSDPDEWVGPGPVDTAAGHPLEAVPTPGHTRGHLVFLDESRQVAYTGDHLLPHTVPSSGSDPVPTRSVVSAQLDSLRLMLTRPDLLVLPAHGAVGPRTHARADEQIASLEGRVDRCREALATLSVPSTALEVARRLPWAAERLAFDTLAPPDQRRAMVKTIAYLEHLVESGAAEAISGEEGVVRYHPVDVGQSASRTRNLR